MFMFIPDPIDIQHCASTFMGKRCSKKVAYCLRWPTGEHSHCCYQCMSTLMLISSVRETNMPFIIALVIN